MSQHDIEMDLLRTNVQTMDIDQLIDAVKRAFEKKDLLAFNIIFNETKMRMFQVKE